MRMMHDGLNAVIKAVADYFPVATEKKRLRFKVVQIWDFSLGYCSLVV